MWLVAGDVEKWFYWHAGWCIAACDDVDARCNTYVRVSLVVQTQERFLCRRVVVAIAGRIAQSVEHSANNAAVQGSSPCMTILLTFLASVSLQPRFSPAPSSVVLIPL